MLPRLHLVELEDLGWLPTRVRDYSTDYLEFMQSRLRVHEPMVPLLVDALERSGSSRLVDLCSGGGGPILAIVDDLRAGGVAVRVTLTDRFPNVPAFERARARSGGVVDYAPRPIDARAVPSDLAGIRTLFNAFHHFRPRDARRILESAVAAGQPIAIFEIPRRSLVSACSFVLAPLMVMAATPFMRPFRWSRLGLTYALPLVPLTCLWDGVVSQLRAYTPHELAALATDVAGDAYTWNAGVVPIRSLPVRLTYLVGLPAR